MYQKLYNNDVVKYERMEQLALLRPSEVQMTKEFRSPCLWSWVLSLSVFSAVRQLFLHSKAK